MLKKKSKKVLGRSLKKTTAKPVRKKGMVTLKSLLGSFGTPVHFISTTIGAIDNGFDRFGEQTLRANNAVITNVVNYSGNTILYVTMYFSKSKELRHYYLNASLEVELLEGVQGEALLKEYQDFTIATLENQLGHSFYLGSDPEIFVEDSKGNVIPAFTFLGSKEKPNKINEGGMLYWDGFQAEFTTPATSCLDSQTFYVQRALRTLASLLTKVDPAAKISARTVMPLSADHLEKSKEEHVQFGCMPSLNIYGMEGAKMNGREVPFRPAGGHIHFGIGQKTDKQISDIVKALDAVIGVACVSLFEKYDDPKRRQLYGLAGEYRLPSHGLEYRTLSNAWIFHPLLMNLVNDTARKALMFGLKGLHQKCWNTPEKEVVRIINQCDVKAARQSLKDNKNAFIKIIQAAYGSKSDAEFVFNIFMEGADSAIKDVTDIHSNWNLSAGSTIYATTKNWRSSKEKLFGKQKIS